MGALIYTLHMGRKGGARRGVGHRMQLSSFVGRDPPLRLRFRTLAQLPSHFRFQVLRPIPHRFVASQQPFPTFLEYVSSSSDCHSVSTVPALFSHGVLSRWISWSGFRERIEGPRHAGDSLNTREGIRLAMGPRSHSNLVDFSSPLHVRPRHVRSRLPEFSHNVQQPLGPSLRFDSIPFCSVRFVATRTLLVR